MKWTVEGADAGSGQDVIIVLDADTKAQAERLARSDGILVEDVRSGVTPRSRGPTICANCQRTIGKLETLHVFDRNIVCAGCREILIDQTPAAGLAPAPSRSGLDYESKSPPARQQSMAARKDTQEYRALGLNSRGVAITIAIVGLFLSPALIGIPLAIWGFAADHMLHQHQKEHGPIEDPHVAKPGRTRAQSITYDEKRT